MALAGADVGLDEGTVSSVADTQPKRIEFCTGRYLRDALRCAAVSLESQVDEINALNVFPVPDGDTGTNMYLTMQAAVTEIDKLEEPALGAVIHAAAHGALMGARGNSGVILSQLFRGMARSLDHKRVASPADLAAAFAEASLTARRGVLKPVEGTILTVARDVVEATTAAASSGGDVREVVLAAMRAARASVARTPDLLPVLQQAGVVDAGGQGLLVIIEGLWHAFSGESAISTAPAAAVPLAELGRAAIAQPAHLEVGFGYCTEFVLRASNLDMERIRGDLVEMGDSLLVVGEPNLVRVHIHTLKPGRVLDYAGELGSLHQIKIDNMQEQHRHWLAEMSPAGGDTQTSSPAAGNEAVKSALDLAEASLTSDALGGEVPVSDVPSLADLSLGQASDAGISVIAVSPGPGLDSVLVSLGAIVVSGGQTMNPSTRELLDAVERAPTERVIVLPNNGNIVLTAQQVRALAEKEVAVVPTETLPQGIAALLAFRLDADLATNASLMLEAARLVDTLEITRAVRSSRLDGLHVREGELIGLLNGRLEVTGKAHERVIRDLIRKARPNGRPWELATFYFGARIQPSEAEALLARLRGRYHAQQFQLIRGEQPFYDYIISIE